MHARRSRGHTHIRRIARRLRSQGGFAIPTTLLMMLTAFAVVSVGVVAASNTQHGTIRDQSSKAAVQLAENGINEAMLRFNNLTAAAGNLCSPLGVSPVSGWCVVGPVQDPSGGTYSYQVYVGTGTKMPQDNQGNLELKVVGTGTMGGTTRRVLTDAKSSSSNVFSGAQVKAAKDITVDSNATIHAGTAAGGDITLAGNARQCGQASVGVGHHFNTASNTGYFSDPDCQTSLTTVNQQNISLPPVQQGDAATVNDNGRFFSQDPVSAIQGNNGRACWNGRDANGTTGTCAARHLEIGNASAVTLSGSVYSFCKLTMSSNSSLLVAGGQSHKVVIYFDSPENCGYPSGTAQLQMSSNSRITSNDGTPVQLLFVGSTTRQTLVSLSANTDINAACQQNVIIYAPLSDIVLDGGGLQQGGSTYCGALAGQSIHLNSNVDLKTRGDADLTLQPQVPYYQPDDYVECTGPAGVTGSYDAGC